MEGKYIAETNTQAEHKLSWKIAINLSINK